MSGSTLEWDASCSTNGREDSPSLSRVRVGAVSYLNSKPLIEGLGNSLREDQLVLDVPSRLADELSVGKLDVALIPSVEYFSRSDYKIISDACIATRGPVLSVKLYSRVPLGDIRTLALDEGSRTSVALTRVMLQERYGVIPELIRLPLSATTKDAKTDAVLLIGDRAIHPPQEQFVETWDLGEEWVNWTGLPFVFAMWVARKDVPESPLAQLLEQSRNRGMKNLQQIATREAKPLGISEETAYNYLKDNLHFQFGSAEWNGLQLFRELVGQLEENPVLSQTKAKH
ncbi:menaquinone biosynthesis protein [Rubinisphaera sp.]|uniref:menaquinone biosynthetic enzyme MqnA/MqnD family protein n=1 Tax=Rubinisphaera sp. TaxID=2024857 RepID=UPI000C0CCF70|nr:menaquinone biosynthesis protein [Rubinisphaera sp.]MBV07968.1 hypothetical protein [Rubinisphaera sp.]HCS52071.1 hypothetical protein [Planctomycetaceae bacterium]|tara:strand:- start:2034 stop:2891 length:858 start_codon:yes stop_codon:yes gene_type:complete